MQVSRVRGRRGVTQFLQEEGELVTFRSSGRAGLRKVRHWMGRVKESEARGVGGVKGREARGVGGAKKCEAPEARSP